LWKNEPTRELGIWDILKVQLVAGDVAKRNEKNNHHHLLGICEKTIDKGLVITLCWYAQWTA